MPDPPAITIEVTNESNERVAGAFGSAVETSVNDTPGYLVSAEGRIGLIWSRSADSPSRSAVATREAEIRAVAESIEFVGQDEWQLEYGTSGPQIPTTTTLP